MTDWHVTSLSDFGRDDIGAAGGKGANLGELVRAGFPVPDGFVVPTDAYERVLDASGLRVHIADVLGADGGDGAAIRAGFAAVEVPEALRAALADAHAKLGGGPVAVRSSATAEDLPGAAFAGQQDTYLNVVGSAALVDAVRHCWGSLWTDRAIAYRRKRRIDSADVRIAVVVQRMVEAETAGVMFTANPVSGDRSEIVVDASTGLGEAVVSGLVTPDHYVLDAGGRVKERTPGRHEVVVTSTPGGGVSQDKGPVTDTPPLPAAVLAELARLGTAVASHFGRPQDIEWAYADGQLWLVQSRPMTALPPPPVRLNHVQRRMASVLLEYLPVRPYPIDMTTWLPYGPAGLMAKVAASVGVVRTFDDILHEEDGVVDRVVPPSPRLAPRVLVAPFRLARRAGRYDPARWTEDPRFVEFLRRTDALARVDLQGLSWSELVRVPRTALDLEKPVADLRIDYLPRSGLALLRLLVALTLVRRRRLLGDLILGAHTRTEAANRALAGLADLVRADARLADAFARFDAVKLVDVIADPAFDGFARAFEDFLGEYGHRETASPILVSPPTWGEAPETALGLVKVLAGARSRSGPDADADADADTDAKADRAGAAMADVLDHPLLRRPWARARIRRWVEAARAGIAFREDSHFYFTKPLPVLRRSLLEMGRRLCEARVLNVSEDVFHLRLEELEALPDVTALPDATASQVRAVVRARAARRDELSGVRLIDPALVFPRTSDEGDALVTGTGAGGGAVTGPVKVIRGPDRFGDLQTGDVLVCPYTNPAWTPLFPRAAAVVVDAGGIASHAAIVAREYGLPAVMGTGRATSVLSDGQLVTVDGDTGRVTAAIPEAS
ncbi:PEP/pyruvate-binding domain-containing protein [Actinopolymorpha sp. B11F2]|uniref:PEP/pyruvate-binding domain-containing protein n=1 Tax=Actinopolymorpha sp. B11F2 TaxID=3160862 RepID=UPI0032E528F3